tara:strand:+ start:31 stop:492 length:462 start_codon:yes stop_codon:yes gene_type:complete
MAFKMKGGKDPMKKNFGSALKKAIPEGAEGLNEMIKSEKGREAAKNMGFDRDYKGALLMKKDNAPMMRMDNSAMKAMGKPAPVKKLTEIPPKPSKQQIQAKAGDKPKQYLTSKITFDNTVDEKAFEQMKKNKLQKNLEEKRKLGYIPQTQREG